MSNHGNCYFHVLTWKLGIYCNKKNMCLKVVSYLIRHTLKKDRNHWKFLLNIKLHFYFGLVHSTHCGPTDKETFQKQLKMKGTLPWTRSVSQSCTVSQPKLQAAFIKRGAVTPVSLWFNLPWDVKQSNKTPLCETGPRKSNPEQFVEVNFYKLFIMHNNFPSHWKPVK